jgi:hypothetical protein
LVLIIRSFRSWGSFSYSLRLFRPFGPFGLILFVFFRLGFIMPSFCSVSSFVSVLIILVSIIRSFWPFGGLFLCSLRLVSWFLYHSVIFVILGLLGLFLFFLVCRLDFCLNIYYKNKQGLAIVKNSSKCFLTCFQRAGSWTMRAMVWGFRVFGALGVGFWGFGFLGFWVWVWVLGFGSGFGDWA